MNSKKTYHKLRVRYGETDQMGYAYYGNYATFFEVGRVEHLRSLGLSYRKLEESGIMLPVADFSVKYIKPAFYDDELTVETQIDSLKGPRIVFSYELKRGDVLLAIASTTLVFVSSDSMRPIKPPSEVQSVIQSE